MGVPTEALPRLELSDEPEGSPESDGVALEKHLNSLKENMVTMHLRLELVVTKKFRKRYKQTERILE